MFRFSFLSLPSLPLDPIDSTPTSLLSADSLATTPGISCSDDFSMVRLRVKNFYTKEFSKIINKCLDTWVDVTLYEIYLYSKVSLMISLFPTILPPIFANPCLQSDLFTIEMIAMLLLQSLWMTFHCIHD